MDRCVHCRHEIYPGNRFCPSCGIPVAASGEEPAYNEAKDIQDNRVLAIFSYLYVLVLVPIFAARESRFCRFHANQGLVLAIVYLAYSVMHEILDNILFALPGMFILRILYGLLAVIPVAYSIIGIVNVTRGAMRPLPVIGGIVLLKW